MTINTQRVLSGIASGLSHRAIAKQEGIGLATVSRIRNANTAYQRYLLVPDIHGKDADPTALNILAEFQKDFKPHHTVFFGDLLNVDSVSKYDNPGGESLTSEFANANAVLDRFKPDVFLEGNHEERLRRPGLLKAELMDALDPQRWLNIKKRGIQWVPYTNDPEKIFRVGHLTMIHGFAISEHACKTEAQCFGCVVHAHTHRIATFQPKNAYFNHTGFNIGCLCRLNLEYQSTGLPRGWAQGFAYAYIFPDGNFSLYQVRLINENIVINDKVYKR